MKKALLSIVVLFSAVTIAFACGENCKKTCCKKEEKTAKACAGKEAKSCAKAKSCCKKGGSATAATPEVKIEAVTPATPAAQ